MTLVRYTPAGALDTTLRRQRLRDRAVRRHARQQPRQQRRHRHDARRGRQHHRRRLRRVAVHGRRALHRQRRLQRRSRLLRTAPDRLHGPRARPARDGHRARRLRPRPASVDRRSRHAGRHVRPARRRHAAGDHVGDISTTACGTYSDNGGLSLGSSGVQIDGLGHDGTVAPDLVSQAGRYYEGVATLANGSYVVATTTGPDGAAWVERFTAAGVGALDTTFNALGAVPVASPVAGREPARDQARGRRLRLRRRRVARRERGNQPPDARRPHRRHRRARRLRHRRHRPRQGRRRQQHRPGARLPGRAT